MSPQPAQRIQCLLKPKVLDIVKQLSEELDLTLSKTVALLVYEALENRGVKVKPSSSVLTDIKVPDTVNKELITKKTEELDPEDLDLLKKIKTLKTLGLF
jgi:hypothetical protein